MTCNEVCRMNWQCVCAVVTVISVVTHTAPANADQPDLSAKGQLQVKDDDVRISIRSTAYPSWQAVIDRRKGGIITELCIPADADNLVATDGGRFEGLCNLVYVDFEDTGKPE